MPFYKMLPDSVIIHFYRHTSLNFCHEKYLLGRIEKILRAIGSTNEAQAQKAVRP